MLASLLLKWCYHSLADSSLCVHRPIKYYSRGLRTSANVFFHCPRSVQWLKSRNHNSTVKLIPAFFHVYILVLMHRFCLYFSYLSNHLLKCPSNHSTSSLLSPGPPAQWPHIDGNTSHCPIPGFIFATSYSESSGLGCSLVKLFAYMLGVGGMGWVAIGCDGMGWNGCCLREIEVCFCGED